MNFPVHFISKPVFNSIKQDVNSASSVTTCDLYGGLLKMLFFFTDFTEDNKIILHVHMTCC